MDVDQVLFRQKMNRRGILRKYPAITVYFVALLIRIAVVAGYAFGFFNGSLKGGDSGLYFEIAKNLLAGNGFATNDGPTAFVSPLYPIFLAGSMSLFGENYPLISLTQAFLSALVCVYIYKIAEITFASSNVALAAGFLAAIHYELILWSNAQLLTESIYVLFFCAGIMTIVAGIRSIKRQNLYFAISGLTLALAALTRPTAIAVAFGLFIILAAASFFDYRIQFRGPIVFAIVFAATMFPWGLRNYQVFGSFTISSLEGGHVFWLGNNPEFDKYEHPDFTRFGGYTAMIPLNPTIRQKLKGKTSVEQNEIFAKSALEHIKNYPAAFAKRALYKNWNMWRPNFSVSSWRNSLISYTFYPIVLFGALIGIFLAWKSAPKGFLDNLGNPVFLLIAVLLMHILIHSVITGEIRFRVPLWIVLIPLSAYFWVRMFEILLKQQRKTL